MKRQLRAPIVILGSPRSGTTMLGNLIATHPDVAYWEEPRTIWSLGKNAWRDDDRLEASDLSPTIARRIDERFHRFLVESGRSRFAEKTPSNTLRIPFIHALYPDARIIHLVRDGRAVVASMMKMLEKAPDRGRVIARLRDTPWRDLPALAPIFFRDVLGPRLLGRSKSFWGPRPPGWREWQNLPAPAMLARQWRTLVTTAREDLSRCFPPDQWLELCYESLVANPDAALEAIETVTGLSPHPDFSCTNIQSDRLDSWRESLDAETIELIENETADLLGELGYLS